MSSAQQVFDALFRVRSLGARLRSAIPLLYAVAVLTAVSGCGAVVSKAGAGMANSLSIAILNQDDPELVREALPSYLLLLDSFVESDPQGVTTLSAASQLYAAYGGALVRDADRAKGLTTRARNYGQRALCASNPIGCGLQSMDYATYEESIASLGKESLTALYSYSLSTLAWIRANSDDFLALAELPRVELALEKVMQLEPGDLAANTCMYLGILNTLRPPALGGKPEVGRAWFERGIMLSDGKNLGIKVEYARGYARLIYNRELHDRLLNEVLSADVKQPQLTMFNVMAQADATELMATADDYF